MKKIHICPKCRSTWGRIDNENHGCPNCHGELLPTDVTVEDWQSLSDSEKGEMKKNWFKESVNESAMLDKLLQVNQAMAKDIRIMRRILVFFTVLWGLMLLIGAVNLV